MQFRQLLCGAVRTFYFTQANHNRATDYVVSLVTSNSTPRARPELRGRIDLPHCVVRPSLRCRAAAVSRSDGQSGCGYNQGI